LVTGGASGIGEAVSELLAREGASVAVTDVDDFERPGGRSTHQEGRPGGEFLASRRHQRSALDRGRAEVMKRYGRLDVLVSNAGIGISVPSITQMSLEDWRRQTAINLDGVFLSVKHCLPAMRKTGGGSVIMMSSAGGPARRGRSFRLLRDQGRRAAVCESDCDGVRNVWRTASASTRCIPASSTRRSGARSQRKRE